MYVEDNGGRCLEAWLTSGGALGIYGSFGRGGGNWLNAPLALAQACGKEVKVLDLMNPSGCAGLPGRLPFEKAGDVPDWVLVDQVVFRLFDLLDQENAVLCIRDFARSFLEPARRRNASVKPLEGLFREARKRNFPICVAMSTAHGYAELLRAFSWIWCLGFKKGDGAEKEVEFFVRTAQMATGTPLYDRPPLTRNRALVVRFGERVSHIGRQEVDVEGLFSAGTAAA